MTISRAVLTFALALAAAACAGASTSPSLAPSRPSTPSAPSGGVVVTFQVGAEQFRIELTDPADIDIARKLLAGEEAPGIPNGVVVRGDPSVNTGYSWHIDPASVEFADVTTEVCDGLPSDVEANQITSDRFCPWNAKVIGIEG
ncbi:MAG TPA: hypothetical protein VH723_05085 [Candidatus Limnocylindrales bacterium]